MASRGPELPYGTIVPLARLDVWISIFVENLTIETFPRVNRQKQFGDLSGKCIQVATKQIVVIVHLFIEYWEPQELCSSDTKQSVDQGKSEVHKMDSNTTILVNTTFTSKIFFAANTQ